jgi:hypothetical protein
MMNRSERKGMMSLARLGKFAQWLGLKWLQLEGDTLQGVELGFFSFFTTFLLFIKTKMPKHKLGQKSVVKSLANYCVQVQVAVSTITSAESITVESITVEPT